MRKRIKEVLGSNLFFKTLLLVILGFWPAIIFYDQIILDVAKFTEEWIKIFTSSILVYLLMKYYNMKKKENELRLNLIDVLTLINKKCLSKVELQRLAFFEEKMKSQFKELNINLVLFRKINGNRIWGSGITTADEEYLAKFIEEISTKIRNYL